VTRGIKAQNAPQRAIRAENLTRVTEGTTHIIQRRIMRISAAKRH
jgi:hypothetical protein